MKTQQEIADFLNVNFTLVSKWLHGERSISPKMAARLAVLSNDKDTSFWLTASIDTLKESFQELPIPNSTRRKPGKYKAFTQKDFAEILKTHQSEINRVLKGKSPVSWPLAVKLVEKFPGRSLLDWKNAKPEDVKQAYKYLEDETT